MALILNAPKSHNSSLTLLYPGYVPSENADGNSYYARFKCRVTEYEKVKPTIGEVCPIDKKAYCQSINPRRVGQWFIIDVGYQPINLTATFNMPVGHVEVEEDSIIANEVNDDDVNYPNPHPLFYYKKMVKSWNSVDKWTFDQITGKTNLYAWRPPLENGRYGAVYPAKTMRCNGTQVQRISTGKYWRVTAFEYKATEWDTGFYSGVDFMPILRRS